MKQPNTKKLIQFLLRDARTPHITGLSLGAHFKRLGDEQTAHCIWELTAQEVQRRTKEGVSAWAQ